MVAAYQASMYSAASNGKPRCGPGNEVAKLHAYAANFMKLGNGTCALITTCMLAHADLLYCYIYPTTYFHNVCFAVNMQYCCYLANFSLQPWTDIIY